MNREISPDIGQNNRIEYHQIIGGRKKYWDKRFCDNPSVIEARELLMELKKSESMLSLAKKIGVSSSTISHVAGGNAGLIPKPEYNGRSTTEYVMDSLREMVKSRHDV